MASKIRNGLIATALKCFATSGYSGCSTKSIADEANASEHSLFRLFKSKEELFTEALRLARERSLSQAEFERLLGHPEFAKAIRNSMLAVVKKISNDALRLSRFAMLEKTDIALEVLSPTHVGRVATLAKRIRAGVSSGDVRRDVDPAVAAYALYYTVRNVPFDSLYLRKKRAAQAALVAGLVDLWLRGVQK